VRVLLVDDEAPARLKLRRLFAAEPDAEIVGEAPHGALAVSRIRTLEPDLVFLDVQMPVLDGFGVIEQLGPEAMPPVVFVTAFDEHAVRAFEVHALDYLLKPVSPERFRSALERVRAHLVRRPRDDEQMVGRFRQLLADSGRDPYLHRILVQDERRAHLLAVDRITHLAAERNYVRLHTPGAMYEIRSTLTLLERRLDPKDFLRINKGAIVRLEAIKELHPWSHGDYRVVLSDGTALTWSRRYRAKDAGAFLPGD
jgi:two-component system LytT family response regulator